MQVLNFTSICLCLDFRKLVDNKFKVSILSFIFHIAIDFELSSVDSKLPVFCQLFDVIIDNNWRLIDWVLQIYKNFINVTHHHKMSERLHLIVLRCRPFYTAWNKENNKKDSYIHFQIYFCLRYHSHFILKLHVVLQGRGWCWNKTFHRGTTFHPFCDAKSQIIFEGVLIVIQT